MKQFSLQNIILLFSLTWISDQVNVVAVGDFFFIQDSEYQILFLLAAVKISLVHQFWVFLSM